MGAISVAALVLGVAASCVAAGKPGLDQQVTKESQDARGGTWPPPAVFGMPEPVSAAPRRERAHAVLLLPRIALCRLTTRDACGWIY